MDLTKRQQEIFDFIRKYSAKYGYPPTVRDIGKAVGLASSSTVHAHLANLEKIGLLRRDPSKPRAIELLDRAGAAPRWRACAGSCAPTACRCSARWPRARRCSRRRTSRTTCRCPTMAGGGDGEYLLQIRGESMKDAGILDGDYVVVHSQDTAQDGDIVVALLGEEATVKRFFRKPTTSACSPRTRRWSRSAAKRSRCSGASWALLRSV